MGVHFKNSKQIIAFTFMSRQVMICHITQQIQVYSITKKFIWL
jgi:hypothetical protein